ncbi:hypothetical protein [Pseudoduganella albidiflava]|uniref:Uncharacterized protein n=1 Tax=Pseudoduganella albidiflava TaxID=321983 RepID=A0A411X1A2_9BURK|nr:hypothetical protein [Pseudoduganella albidiflava]QBI02743.1 hypothetical protein EYF70_19225 [Pseudoduganella albidiflava]GGY55927.1 hypothetical protein GCM10007387_42940 [Pseudoduganella albidiflava]
MLNIDEALEIFDNFIFEMDDRIEAIEAEAEKHGLHLTHTMDSLEKIELLFFKLTRDASEDDRESLIISFGRLIGEIVRIEYNGRWHLSLDDPKNVYYNLPVIIGHAPMKDLEFSPLFAMRALWLRKKHGLLRQIIMGQIHPRELDLDDLIEEE